MISIINLFNMETGAVKFIGKVIEIKGALSLIRINNDFCPGLLRLEEHTHLDILYWFHLRDNEEHRKTLQVIPRRHGETTFRGVFASHSPSRPNPIGLTRVELLSIDECILTVKGLDAFENSPIVDIKPRSHDY
jgi:tRNA-Thr(GGU) m(6)t(6)A37 methyltransferase TsaA